MNAEHPSTPRLAHAVQTLHRKRRLLIAGVLTVLPAAALAPTLLAPAQTPDLLAAVDQMATRTAADAQINERAVQSASAKKRQAAARLFRKPSTLTTKRQPQTPLRQHIEVNLAPVVRAEVVAESASNVRQFNGRPVRPVRTIRMLVTAYSPDERSCGDSADGITASGYSVWTNAMKMVAADTDVLPFGTLVSVPGYDESNLVPVLDRGGAIKGDRLDVLYATHERAEQWGVQTLEVTVWEYADGLPGDFAIAYR